jgi:cell fate (sporulation/competence/biofilm development) regulator YlbF (YheA/YmcA/DUF963 family)
METEIQESTLTRKTRELCQSILDQPEVQALHGKIDAFMADNAARTQYENLMTMGQGLHEKQHSGVALEASEIAEFEKHREAFLNNSVARSFLDAQEELQAIQKSIVGHIKKTFELGRVPEAHEVDSGGGCGSGCGCSH